MLVLKSVSFHCIFITDLPSGRPEVEQTDLCPTLSFLLGIPIPQNNIGQVITDMLQGYSVEQKLLAQYHNALQILRLFKVNVPNYEQGLYCKSFCFGSIFTKFET